MEYENVYVYVNVKLKLNILCESIVCIWLFT